MTGITVPEGNDPADEQPYELDYGLDTTAESEPYSYDAWQSHTAETYEEMLDSDWLDQPLRDLLETRINDLTK